MIKIKQFLLLLVFAGLSYQPLFAQEAIIKDLLETKRDLKFALYPSTLRMINLKQNQQYNEMVSGVEKLLIFTLDSATQADKSYMQLTEKYLSEGFEEYAMAFGGGMNMAILGKDGRGSNQLVGFLDSKDMTVAFYLRGTIAWQKIPTLINTIRGDDFIDILSLSK